MLKVEIPDTAKNYILELLNDKKIVVSTEVITKNRSITYANYKVGSYYTRIIYDENKNGIWGTGSLALGTQPERIWNNPTEISNRANFLISLTFAIPPAPQSIKQRINDKESIFEPKN